MSSILYKFTIKTYNNNLLLQNITPHEIKHRFVAKYDEKLLVWAAISPKGITKVRMRPSGQAVNHWVYINECLDDS
jgi:hypothetical protein